MPNPVIITLAIAIAYCVYLVVSFIAKTYRKYKVNQLFKVHSHVKQHYVYGWCDKLADYSEMNVWWDYERLVSKYPDESNATLKLLHERLMKHEYDDFLYVRSKLVTVIRVPVGASISFGNNCHQYKDYASILGKSDDGMNASAINIATLAYDAKLLKTVRHVA